MAGRRREPGTVTGEVAARRVLPQSPEAERAVLGGLLFNGKAMARIGDVLEPADFYDKRHEAVFAAMRELESRFEPIDVITVSETMRRLGTIATLAAAGGDAYLAELANENPTSEHIAHHAKLVQEKSRARALILKLSEVLDEGYSGQFSTEELIAKAAERVHDVQSRGGRPSYVHRRALLHEQVKLLQERYHAKQAITGVPTGIAALDERTAGLQPEELILVAGRPSMGKTALAMGWVEHAAAQHGVPCLVFSLEMGAQSLIDRALASEARVENQRIRTGFLESADWNRLVRAMGEMAKAPIAIDVRSAPSLSEVQAVCRRWRADPQFFPPQRAGAPVPKGLVVIDYLQLMRGSTKTRDEGSREREIAEISRGLKQLAKELAIPIVALAQLNRSVESRADKRPMNSDLRESGSLEQDADVICFVYRDEVYDKDTKDKGIAELILGKLRNGAPGTVRATFDGRYTRFDNLAEGRTDEEYHVSTSARPRRRPDRNQPATSH